MSNDRNFFTLLLYAFGFFLLWEWLRPLEKLTDTGGVQYFVIFIAMSLLISFIRIPWWIGMMVKAGYILFALHELFYKNKQVTVSWVRDFGSELKENMGLVLTAQWYELSDLFRSLLFFVLLWLMTYLLRYWLVVRNRIFIFYMMTVIYVTVLDTFTEYSGQKAIIRVVAIGFALLGLLFFRRMLEREQIGGSNRLLRKWSVPLAIMIAASLFIGFASPKAGPVWPDPVPFLQSKADYIRQGGYATIGYGEDDSKLGGPFLGDSRVVFTVKTPARQYWKIENKDIYTGKGWEIGEGLGIREFQSGEEFSFDMITRPEDPVREAVFDIKTAYP
ncbi:MAG TPA: transglutaminase, partial [Bacillaceae bacterium]